MTDRAALRAIVSGRVQGVMFRAFVTRRAAALDVTGYTRNLADGTVEVVAEGRRQDLEALVEKLRQGPPYAVVEKVATVWSDYTGKHASFVVRY
jgi:acylphosphatase